MTGFHWAVAAGMRKDIIRTLKLGRRVVSNLQVILVAKQRLDGGHDNPPAKKATATKAPKTDGILFSKRPTLKSDKTDGLVNHP